MRGLIDPGTGDWPPKGHRTSTLDTTDIFVQTDVCTVDWYTLDQKIGEIVAGMCVTTLRACMIGIAYNNTTVNQRYAHLSNKSTWHIFGHHFTFLLPKLGGRSLFVEISGVLYVTVH